LPQLNFTLQASSAGRALFGLDGLIAVQGPPTLVLPIEIRIENGGKVPAFGPAGFMGVLLEPLNGGPRTTFLASVQLVRIPGPGPLDYRVVVENMPPGYRVKSVSYDSAPMRTGTLHLPAARFDPTTIYPSSVQAIIAAANNPPPSLPTGPPLVITWSVLQMLPVEHKSEERSQSPQLDRFISLESPALFSPMARLNFAMSLRVGTPSLRSMGGRLQHRWS
jgi:hypothetical protein